MIYLLALLPATALTIAGYFVLYLSARTEGTLRTFGKYLGFWAFTLAGLVILGALFAAARFGYGASMYGWYGGPRGAWYTGPHGGWYGGPRGGWYGGARGGMHCPMEEENEEGNEEGNREGGPGSGPGMGGGMGMGMGPPGAPPRAAPPEAPNPPAKSAH
jgi:hypothetical protein